MKLLILILKKINGATIMNAETESLLKKEYFSSATGRQENMASFLLRL